MKELEHNKDDEYHYAMRRGASLIRKHPELKDLVTYDPIGRRWVDSWMQSEKSIEEGVVELAVYLCKAKESISDSFIKYAGSLPQPTPINIELSTPWDVKKS